MISFDFRVNLGANRFEYKGSVKNTITAVIGRSGAGKSTLANALAGLLSPDEGVICSNHQVFFDSKRRINLPSHKRGVGFVFQSHRLFPHMTVLQNLLFGRRFGGRANSLDAREVLAYLELEEKKNRNICTLSGGEAQRVALGRALISATSFLVMDEPLSSLDPKLRDSLMHYLKNLPSLISLPILYITHSTEEVRELSSETIVIGQNRILFQGSTSEILQQASSSELFNLPNS